MIKCAILRVIVYFRPTLTKLNLTNTSLSSLKYLPRTLTELDVSYTHITSIDHLPTSVTIFKCEHSRLISLHAPNSRLQYISVSHNMIATIDLSNTQLIHLNAANNTIVDIDNIPTKHLTYLNVSYNQISSLQPLQKAYQLKSLYCTGNKISSLKGLSSLVLDVFHCDDNVITSFRYCPYVKRHLCIRDNLTPNIDIPIVENMSLSSDDDDIVGIATRYKHRRQQLTRALHRWVELIKVQREWFEGLVTITHNNEVIQVTRLCMFDMLIEKTPQARTST